MHMNICIILNLFKVLNDDLHCGLSAVPTVHVQGVVGKKASLPCDTQPLSSEDQVAMVLWFKESDGEPLYRISFVEDILYRSNKFKKCNYDVRGRALTQPKLWSSPSGFGARAFFRAAAVPATLLLDNVFTSDAGVYRCRVDFTNSPTRNLRLNFTVITPPERPVIIDAKTRDQTRLLEPYDEGDTLELICEVRGGDPKPRLTWYLENTVIDDSYELQRDGVTINTLTFPSIGRQHLNARLICQASNTNLAPPQTKLLILEINLRPLTVQILNKSQQLSADRSYEVECKATGSRPAAQVTWWKGTRQLRRNSKTVWIYIKLLYISARDLVLLFRTSIQYQYVPIVTLKMGSTLNPGHIKEGEDVYFECNIKANPKATRLSWFKGAREIVQNASTGVIFSDQSLVLQRVDRSSSGEYSCLAHNAEGSATSNSVTLQVRYAPLCKQQQQPQQQSGVWGALRQETVELTCAVDASPQPTAFVWTLDSSGGHTELQPSLYTMYNCTSVLRYTPLSNMDYGTISCFAVNAAGRQETPCVYKIVPAGKHSLLLPDDTKDRPSTLQNCSIVNQSSESLAVECTEGFDGGLPQTFYMEVLELPSLMVRANVTSNFTPSFEVLGVDSRVSYILNLYSANAKGRSEIVTLYTIALRSPDKYTGGSGGLSLSPLLVALLAAAALLSAAVCAVIAALYRRHAARHRKHPPSTNALYSEDSVDSFPRRDKSDDVTYSASPKIDYSSQYELKMEGDVEETDPDIIPFHYDKKPTEVYSKSSFQENEPRRIYSEQSLFSTLTPNDVDSVDNNVGDLQNKALVNRGVTARSADIAAAAARLRPEVVTSSRRVKESCI
ncbi:Titin [Papilio machaon]|uniref:Titin n=1 Tax=Papilio machaon TaxID=76193 RepID=A0A194RJS5_PAPMA|nr:Titin [Papilio machaon]